MNKDIKNYKIIFTGPVGAGKTTAIATLSDIPMVRTDETASDMAASRKPQTTVALDYGLMKVSKTEKIHLYGTPGQERFDFMWDILTEGGIGLILLLDNSRPNTFQDMNFFLEAFYGFIKPNRVVIGVTRADVAPTPTVDDYHANLKLPIRPAIFHVDARIRSGMAMLVEALLYTIDPTLDA